VAEKAIDTSVLIAGVFEWHEDHTSCLTERRRWKRSKEKPYVPAHALLESYSVMTRLPAGLRLRADDAIEVMRGAYGDFPIAPSPTKLWALMEHLAGEGITGGSVYDALILESALAAGAKELITLDSKAFERLAGDRLRVRPPGSD
jgi:predicted nucleic acid-binding protein